VTKITAGKPDWQKLAAIGRLPKEQRGQIPMLVGMDKLEEKVEKLEKENEKLEKENEKLKEKIKELRAGGDSGEGDKDDKKNE